jgi:hypothetical protein
MASPYCHHSPYGVRGKRSLEIIRAYQPSLNEFFIGILIYTSCFRGDVVLVLVWIHEALLDKSDHFAG